MSAKFDVMVTCVIVIKVMVNNITTRPFDASRSASRRRAGEQQFVVRFSDGAPPVRRVPTPLARRLYQICVAMVTDAVAETGLSALQFAALPYLSRKTGEPEIDQNGLATRLGIDKNNTSILVDQLETKNLAERRVNRADRRAHMLYLTPKGEKVLAQLLPRTRAANEKILAPLGPNERDLFLDMLVRIIQGNLTYARPGAGRRKPFVKTTGKGG